MGNRSVKIIGAICALVGVAIFVGNTLAIWQSILPAIQSSSTPRIISGYLMIALAIAIVVGIIGVLLGLFTEGAGGAWVLAMFIIIIVLFIIVMTGLITVDNNVYNFSTLPWLPSLFIIIGAILMMVGQERKEKY